MGVTQILKFDNNKKVGARENFITNTAQYVSSTVLGKYRVTIVVTNPCIMEATLNQADWFTLNSGEELIKNQLYVFDIPISADDDFNIRLTTDTVVMLCRIDKIVGEG